MPRKRRIALIAHDQKKDDLVAFAVKHRTFLNACDLVATGTTGGRIAEACPGLDILRLKSGPLGGDQQIGALIAEREVDLVIFFVDPLTAMPHDVDVKALMRLAIVYDVPMALNEKTAQILVRNLDEAGAGWKDSNEGA
ncbi:methylglyoxal synthase [Nitratireductor basaltis]|uniref:Methylglyoxal synthase n=1 Tax=Nitratireductor basaltis TaxID=472175 RepID=A0A084U5Q0_9HYPH|nr:methylglyoxal synthase [Nitratireductor basaltis]KFB08286.1 Methylglyoxal synthase [Nitratireductor basaltis]